ncbi:MAG: hypothetical protein RLY31_2635 [Bacteroidota bacterium]|jgi:hypothetical protein
MYTQNRRYVFIDYENLVQIKFKKLEKVASRIFVFIDENQENIPLAMVRQLQRAGKDLRWIVAGHAEDSRLNYYIAFVMGRLHQKVERDVEFAVISNDPAFDPLVSFINSSGRNCMRVRRKKEEGPVFREFNQEEEGQHAQTDFQSFRDEEDGVPVLEDDEIITRSAAEAVKRLIRSGNRPEQIATLKNYILLQSQELSLHDNIDRIIQRMKDSNDIDIRNGEVVYNF